ncbi:hypothetical protein V9T40_010640 [Parthenolecanium corni]|uniref:Uncharacterized protein n=1 Tax=Parthenolecanium corni TaxID=536013 RepID=A0AAN9XXU4_9HEMI
MEVHRELEFEIHDVTNNVFSESHPSITCEYMNALPEISTDRSTSTRSSSVVFVWKSV